MLGDAVGSPLLARDCAYAVGLKARRAAGDIKIELVSAKRTAGRAASKLAADDPRRQELAAEAKAAEASLLHAPVELPLPRERAAPAPAASGARKRKREPDPLALSQDQLLGVLDRHVLLAERKMKRGLASLESAEKEETDAQQKFEHWVARVEGGELSRWAWLVEKAKAAKQILRAASHLVTAAEADLYEAKMEMKDAQIKVLFQELEMGLAREEALLAKVDALEQKNEDL